MKFKGVELSAVSKLAMAMVQADGKVERIELAVMATELMRFGVSENDAEKIIRRGDEMEMSKALSVVSNLDSERKRYVTAYLGTIMAADGEVHDKELALWSLISMICDLPTMNALEAVSIMANL